MCMDGMKVKRQMRSALSQSEDVNTSDDTTTDCVQCAQCCMVSSSACVALFTLLFTMRSMSSRMCLLSCTMFRSLLSYIFVREFLVQDVLYLHGPGCSSSSSAPGSCSAVQVSSPMILRTLLLSLRSCYLLAPASCQRPQ